MANVNDEDPATSSQEEEEEQEVNPMDQALQWIGFTNGAQRTALLDNMPAISDVGELESKDITSLADTFAKRTVNEGRFTSDLQELKDSSG